jgi:cyclic pyranopterin phosphate synthase
MKNKLSHINDKNQPAMVDISHKPLTRRWAKAQSKVILPPQVLRLFIDGEIQSPKGPVFQTAIIAGTMAVKQTSALIPFCHPLAIEDCKFSITVNAAQEVVIECAVVIHHATGVEMEALVGVSMAALTIYDMCKGLSHDIIIKETRLIEKHGGKSDFIC